MTGQRMTRNQFFRRGTAASCGAVCLAGVLVILSSVQSRSMLVLGVVALSGLAGLALLFLAFGQETIWQSLSAKSSQLLEPPAEQFESMRIGLALMALGVATFVAQIIVLFPQNDTFAGEDEEAYLVTASEIALSGGIIGFGKSLYSGEFSEANRHPLYLWLLSGSPQFGSGKFLSALLGLWTMGMVLGLCLQRQLGWLRAGIVCVLLGLNSAWGRFAVTVGCEVLMVGLVACVWFQFFGERFRVIVESEKSDSTTEDKTASPVRDDLLTAWVASLFALIWLTKGTGLLLTVGFVVWMFLQALHIVPSRPRGEGTRWKIARQLAVFAAVWVAVASPLLVRNFVRYGSPFHNVNSWLLFVDEYSNPIALSETQSISEAAAVYLETHSPLDIVKREATGLFWETFIIVRSLGPPPLDDARIIPGGMIALLAGFGWLVSRDPAKWLLLIWLGFCVPLFAWYIPVAAGERFALPLLVPILGFAAEGAIHVVGRISEKRRQPFEAYNSA